AYSNRQSKVLRIFPELANVPLVPTQLISAAYDLALFVIALLLVHLSPKTGLTSAFIIVAYNGFRTIIEKYRLSVVNVTTKAIRTTFYRGVATLFTGVGAIYLIYVLSIDSPVISMASAMTFKNYFGAVVADASVITVTSLVFVMFVLTWGVHYGNIGQHFQWSDSCK
ncbi:MAG: prolipoprotein diacylglyceryl transferase family protein, partial [bacterium]